MYIEALHDEQGNILGCYCVDTLPINLKKPSILWHWAKILFEKWWLWKWF